MGKGVYVISRMTVVPTESQCTANGSPVVVIDVGRRVVGTNNDICYTYYSA